MKGVRLAAGLGCGIIFGSGLIIGGMTDPRHVRAFLVMGSGWDPSLAFVLAGAVMTALIGMSLRKRLLRPVLAEQFHEPQRKQIDTSLVLGSCLFGAGWGLSGFCPGPAIASMSFGGLKSLVFLGAMVAGMTLSRIAGSKS